MFELQKKDKNGTPGAWEHWVTIEWHDSFSRADEKFVVLAANKHCAQFFWFRIIEVKKQTVGCETE